MVKDITPELLKKIKTTFVQNIEKNRKIKAIKKKIDLKTATHIDSHEFGIEVGKCLADSFKKNVSSDVLPDGRMYYNIADRVVNETFRQNYQLVHENTKEIQRILNEQANNHLLVNSPINKDRMKGIIERLSHEEDYDKIAWILNEPVVNFSQSVVDDFIEKNADFQYKVGQSPKITRIATGHKPCEWCLRLAGEYDYPTIDREVYKRHANCRCLVDYHPGDGRVQNVHSKQFYDPKELAERREFSQDIRYLNRNEDAQEYKRMIQVIGKENMPMSLHLFQDLKYKDFEKYERLKDKVFIQNNFNKGIWKDEINIEKQERHIKSTALDNKSYFNDNIDIERLYNENKMTSKFRRRRGINEHNYELIDLDFTKDYGIDVYTKKPINGFTIHYSKTGSHLIPTYSKREE